MIPEPTPYAGNNLARLPITHPTPTQERLHRERLARMERMELAARGYAPPKPAAIIVRLPAPPPEPHPDPIAPEAAVPIDAESPYLPDEVPGPAFMSAEIIKQVSLKHRVPVDQIVSPMRSRWIVAARHEAMYRIREERHLSWMQIAHMFNRDHTSVIHGWRKHKALLEAGS